MSNASVNDIAGLRDGLKGSEGALEKETTFDMYEMVEPERESIFKKIATAPTGEGSIDGYMQHPLNFNESKGAARLIRGLSGLLGNLDLAIVDIIIGALDVLKGFKNTKSVGVVPNAND